METLKRAFVAIGLSGEARASLASQLAGTKIPGKVVPPENWHLTIRFLGPVDDVTYDRFLAAMDEESLGTPFGVRLSGIGAFPNPKNATVVWVGLRAGEEELSRLNAAAEESAQMVGLAPEERPYRPHLTIARVRPPRNVEHLLDVDVDVRWRADRLIVYESSPGEGGVEYVPRDSFEFRD